MYNLYFEITKLFIQYNSTNLLQRADVMDKLVDELMARTHELLQPNPGLQTLLCSACAFMFDEHIFDCIYRMIC